MSALELKVPPVAVFLVTGLAMWAVSRWLEPASFVGDLAWPVAGLFVATGIAIGIAGVLAFRRHETTVHPMQPEKATAIVTGGIYRVSRNPMYLGLALILGGWGAFLDAWPTLLLVPGFVLYMTRFQIIPEERALRSRFGDDYDRYRATVRRWL